jgi:amylosucrase
LNYKNPEVFIEILHTLLYLANQGIDILRLDAVPFMWKRLGTVSRNEPEVHMLLKLLKACTSIAAPGLLLKAEAIVQPEEVVKYLGEDECDIAYDFTHMIYLWNSIATQDKKLIERGIQNRPTKPDGTAWINYVRCHDDIGWGFSEQDLQSVGYNPYDHKKFLNDYYTGNFEGSPARGRYFQYNPETEDARITGTTASLLGLEKAIERKDVFEMKTSINKIFLLYSGIMSFGGIPMLYYGDEVGWINDYSYEHDEQRHQDSRWLNRPKINWEKVKERHKLNTVESQIFKGMKKMIDLRKETIEFSGDSHNYRIDNENIHVYSYLRKNGVYKTLVLMNFSPVRQPVHESILWRAGLDEHVYDRFSNQPLTIKDNQIVLQPYQFCWIIKRSK